VLTAVVVVMGVTVSLSAGAALAVVQRHTAQDELGHRATLVANTVEVETGRYVDALRGLAAATGAVEKLSADRFTRAVEPLRAMRLPGASTVAFLAPAVHGRIPQVQRHWRALGASDLVLRPYGNGPDHVFSIFSVPLDGRPAARTGTDATQLAEPAEALRGSRRSGQVTVSDAFHLIRDRGLPAEQRQLSFAVAAPVYGLEDGAGRRPFLGWVVMGLRGRSFMDATLHQISQNLLDVTLSAHGSREQRVVVADLRSSVSGERDLSRDLVVRVAQQSWRLHISAPGSHLPGGDTGLPAVVILAGMALSLLLGALVQTLATSRARAEAKVRSATAEARSAEREARRQASLLEAVMNSIAEGVGVVDPEGRFLLHNPAARSVLGIDEETQVGGPNNWPGVFGLYTPDGHTPFPVDQLPLVRALAGESVDAVEILVRNASSPEGVPVTVSARPLGSTSGQLGAVAVFHDITSRKRHEAAMTAAKLRLEAELSRREATELALREQEADLKAFAGIVAHDLKSPLAGVAGFADILREDLSRPEWEELVGREPMNSLERILSGVDRMRRLIDDLLLYATARDGTYRPEPVDLHAVVTEVISERTAHLRGSGADLTPDIYTGPLPTVLADPVLVRQLLDNLIGNALKYTRLGQVAQVEISAHHATGRWVRVEIADRGSGIPPGQHHAVFTSFHRAHTGATHTGTGLGLAICQRIIERHAGNIDVIDNPGGGSRFRFTLPLAVTETAAAPTAGAAQV
jgi:signal transduction histidine kinase